MTKKVRTKKVGMHWEDQKVEMHQRSPRYILEFKKIQEGTCGRSVQNSKSNELTISISILANLHQCCLSFFWHCLLLFLCSLPCTNYIVGCTPMLLRCFMFGAPWLAWLATNCSPTWIILKNYSWLFNLFIGNCKYINLDIQICTTLSRTMATCYIQGLQHLKVQYAFTTRYKFPHVCPCIHLKVVED
jgi:hypothetical protein